MSSGSRRLPLPVRVHVTCTDIASEGLSVVHLDQEQAKLQFGFEMHPRTGFVWGLLPGESGVVLVRKIHSGVFFGILQKTGMNLQDSARNPQPAAIAWRHPRYAITSEVSPMRIDEDCEAFTECGGCKMRHMTYEQTLEFKQRWFRAQIQRERVNAPDPEWIAGDGRIPYRNNVQLHVSRERELGFFTPYSYRVKPIPGHGCRIFDSGILSNLPESVREEIGNDRARNPVLRLRLAADGDHSITVANAVRDKQAQAHEIIEYCGEKIRIEFPATGFFQVNSGLLPLWLDQIGSALPEQDKPVRILELFSGFGFITGMLSLTRNIESYGYDLLDEQTLARCEIRSASGPVPGAAFFRRNYRRQDLLTLSDRNPFLSPAANPDVILLNPARAGFPPANFSVLLDSLPDFQGNIIYSSCHAATFARDAGFLQGRGYQMDRLHLLDFFPYTSHYEVVARFRLQK